LTPRLLPLWRRALERAFAPGGATAADVRSATLHTKVVRQLLGLLSLGGPLRDALERVAADAGGGWAAAPLCAAVLELAVGAQRLSGAPAAGGGGLRDVGGTGDPAGAAATPRAGGVCGVRGMPRGWLWEPPVGVNGTRQRTC